MPLADNRSSRRFVNPSLIVSNIMNATRFVGPCGVVLCCLLATAAGAESPEPATSPSASAPEDGLRATLTEYVAAYNRHDAAALAATWTEEGVYEDGQSGERLAGQDTIRHDFAALFSQRDDLSLTAQIDRIRLIRPDVAHVTGQAVTAAPDQSPRASRFVAVLVRERGRWLLDSVTETLLPAENAALDRSQHVEFLGGQAPDDGESETPPPATDAPRDRLRDLQFLVGRWLDDSGDARVTTRGYWSANRSFLIRCYQMETGDGWTHQGSQVIGWDPRQQRVRCWMFDVDGAFGEGTWTQGEDGWIVKYRQVLADGRRAGGTQVISRVDDETLTIQSMGQEIEGVTLPASEPIRVVRVDVPTQK
jgi:uncharacterized protein (TIGR02246 family)